MRCRRRFALALLVVCLVVFGSCKKHSTLSRVPPNIPTDTVPGNDSVPGNDTIPTDTDSIPGNDTVPAPGPPKYEQVPVHYAVNGNVGGYYEALPPSYDSTEKKYPLLLFLHGGGELGNGTTELPLILKNSLTKRLHEKTFPVSFNVNGEEFSFIIISPQFKAWPSVSDVRALFQHLTSKYRVDPDRIYLAGLSMGGGATWEYAGSSYGSTVAAIVPICGASWADSTVAKRIAANDVPGWAFHNVDDGSVTVNSTKRYVNIINAEQPVHPVRMTLWPSGGHDAWTLASDPEYKEEGKNIYEWMLQFSR
jgi:predicted peptidase